MLSCDSIDQLIDYEYFVCNNSYESYNEKTDIIKIKENCENINVILDFYFDNFESQCNFDNEDFTC